MADISEKLAQLDEAIEAGVTRSSSDGISSEVDLQHLEKVRRDLRQQDQASIAAGKVRVGILGVNLSGAF